MSSIDHHYFLLLFTLPKLSTLFVDHKPCSLANFGRTKKVLPWAAERLFSLTFFDLSIMTQNPFVQKFTKEETDGVAKLKEKLPEILKNAFKTEEPEPYTLWGVALDKDSTDERLDVLLVKFLRAR